MPAPETYLKLRLSLRSFGLILVESVFLDNTPRILGPPSTETWPNAVKLPDYKVTILIPRCRAIFILSFILRLLHVIFNKRTLLVRACCVLYLIQHCSYFLSVQVGDKKLPDVFACVL